MGINFLEEQAPDATTLCKFRKLLDENGITKVSVRFADEDLWLTELQIAEIYDTSRQNINQHIANIY